MTEDQPVTTYGYVGLGNMGEAMVGHLLSTGAAVHVFDLDQSRIDAVVALGAIAEPSAAAVGASAEIVSICVPAAHHVAAVLAGPLGLAATMGEGKTILVHSTVAPETMVEACATARGFGVDLHDACVAGGVESAKSGELVILGGGLADLSPAASAVLNIYGSKVIDAGPVGAGAALKLAFNTMTYAQFGAAAVAFDIVKTAGGDTSALVDAWRHVGQLTRLTENFLPVLSIPAKHVVGRVRDSMQASVDLAEKDLELADAALRGPGAFHDFLDAVRAAMPDVFLVRSADDQK
jgi:3-hydroxyisobutyrate dehydrogenase-like beta-hydroxyacid dehydrogenase